jgi:hypothetical protein
VAVHDCILDSKVPLLLRKLGFISVVISVLTTMDIGAIIIQDTLFKYPLRDLKLMSGMSVQPQKQ